MFYYPIISKLLEQPKLFFHHFVLQAITNLSPDCFHYSRSSFYVISATNNQSRKRNNQCRTSPAASPTYLRFCYSFIVSVLSTCIYLCEMSARAALLTNASCFFYYGINAWRYYTHKHTHSCCI